MSKHPKLAQFQKVEKKFKEVGWDGLTEKEKSLVWEHRAHLFFQPIRDGLRKQVEEDLKSGKTWWNFK